MHVVYRYTIHIQTHRSPEKPSEWLFFQKLFSNWVQNRHIFDPFLIIFDPKDVKVDFMFVIKVYADRNRDL